MPVLSKQATSTRPAIGMRNGSVQKTERRARLTSDVLTAMVSSIGSSGGMTDVTIMTQLSRSLKRSREGSRNPVSSTCQAASTAKNSRKRMKHPVSSELAVTRSVEWRMVRTRRPWAVSKPVRRTTARQPPSGVLSCECGLAEAAMLLPPPPSPLPPPACGPPLPPAAPLLPPLPLLLCCSTRVPPNSTWLLCALTCSRSSAPSPPPTSASATFHCGVDSPVSTASSAITPPASKRQSAGTTTCSAMAAAAAEETAVVEGTEVLPGAPPPPPVAVAPADARTIDTRSPGSSASPGRRSHAPERRTYSRCLGVCRARSSLRLRRRWKTTVHSKTTSMPSVNSE